MKTPDEIKKGLGSCSAYECDGDHTDCPYIDNALCIRAICGDALAYIRQLESERDAYREELKTELGCNTCKHFDNDAGAVSGYCEDCNMWSNWEWRGVQKEE